MPSWTSASTVAEVGPGFAILDEGDHPLADPAMRLRDPRAGRRRRDPVAPRAHQRQPQVQRLGRAQQLDRQDLLHVPQHGARVPRRASAPIETWSSWFADVGMESADDGWASTLFSDARAAAVYWTIISPLFRPGSGVRNAGRPPFSARVQEERRPPLGDGAQLGQRELGEVERQRDRLAVEVAAGDHEAAARREGVGRNGAALGEHERVVRRGVELHVEHAPEVVERVADRAVDLRHAAQRVRVLDLVRRPVVRALEPRVAQQVAQLGRHRDLAGVRPRQLVRRGVRDLGPQQRLDRHRRCDRRRADQPVGVRQRAAPRARSSAGCR